MPVATVARIAPLDFVGLIAQFFGQFGFQHLLQRLGEQSGKDAFFAEKIIHRPGGG